MTALSSFAPSFKWVLVVFVVRIFSIHNITDFLVPNILFSFLLYSVYFKIQPLQKKREKTICINTEWSVNILQRLSDQQDQSGWNIPGWLWGGERSNLNSLQGWVDVGKDLGGFLEWFPRSKRYGWDVLLDILFLSSKCFSWNIILNSFLTLYLFCGSQPSASRAKADFCYSLEILLHEIPKGHFAHTCCQ